MKKIFPFLLSLCLIVGCFSISASAETYDAGMPSASLDVFYELSNQYAVNIPSSVNISNGDIAVISLEYLLIDDTHQVEVKIDHTVFNDAGNFELQSSADSSKMLCDIYKSGAEIMGMEQVSGYTNEVPLVIFANEMQNSDINLSFMPRIQTASVAGSYQGRITFSIALADRSEG